MKLKKNFCILLTMILCLTSSVPTFAAETGDTATAPETAIPESILESETSAPETVIESETSSETTAPESVIESENAAPETIAETEPAAPESQSEPSQPSISEAYNSMENYAAPAATSSATPSSLQAEASAIFNGIKDSLPVSRSRSNLSSQELMNTAYEMLIYINLLRTENGLEPLVITEELINAAAIRAEECQVSFEHTRPDGSSCFTILNEMSIPYMAAGENIAKGQPDVLSVMQSWWNSEGHRNNILNSTFQAVGVGLDTSTGIPTWVQIFTGGYTPYTIAFYNASNIFQLGKSLQEQGILLEITFTNGMVGYMPLLDSMVSGYDPTITGTQWVRVYYMDCYADITIEVTDLDPDPIDAFVSRLYTEVLGRTPDPSGLAEWSEVLKNGQEQGAKVAQGFIDSDEFKSRNLSDEAYVTVLYHTFFDREPDSAGLNAWIGVLNDGLSRLHVFKGFAESDEFTKICANYGIVRGNAELTAPRDQNEGVTKFLVRCYRLCLGREADENGLNSWCTQILTGANTAKQAAYGFIFSNEFQAKNLSDEDYVKTLYRVFMNREADSAGLIPGSMFSEAARAGNMSSMVLRIPPNSENYAKVTVFSDDIRNKRHPNSFLAVWPVGRNLHLVLPSRNYGKNLWLCSSQIPRCSHPGI